jgi:phosphatidate cytidylyltransferase
MSSTTDPRTSLDSTRVGISPNKLAVRIRTAVIVGLISIAAILATSEIPIYAVCALLVYFGGKELQAILRDSRRWEFVLTSFAATASVLILNRAIAAPFAGLIAAGLGTSALVFRVLRKKPDITDLISTFWLAGPVGCGLWLHNISADSTRIFSPNLLILVALPLWLGDTAAYFIGKSFGRHPLAPKISPKKTVEGSIANLVTCLIASITLARVMNSSLPTPITDLTAILVGLTTGICGQIGDLLESAVKRSIGVKDSGNILPGHGGVLDRVDSLLFSVVPASLILYFLYFKA